MTQQETLFHYVLLLATLPFLFAIGCERANPPTASSQASSRSGNEGAKQPSQSVCHPIVGKGYYTKDDGLNPRAVNYFKRNSELLQYVRENPESEMADEALLMVADHCTNRKEYDQAIESLTRVIEQYPDSAFSRQVCHGTFRGPPPPATPNPPVLRHIRDHPTFSADVATCMLAVLYEQLGRKTEALSLLEQHIKEHPRGRWIAEDDRFLALPGRPPYNLERVDETIRYDLARMYYEDKDFARAEQVLRKSIDMHSKSAPMPGPYLDLLAEVYKNSGRAKEEKETLVRLASLWKERKVIRVLRRRPFNDPMSNSDRPPYEGIATRWSTEIEERLETLNAIEKQGSASKQPGQVPLNPETTAEH